MTTTISQSRIFRAVSSLHFAFLWSHATSVLDERKYLIKTAVAAAVIVDDTPVLAVSHLGAGARLASWNGSGIYLQFLRFSKRVLAKDFMFKDVLIIGMMVYNCDCFEVTEDQEERQNTNRTDVDHDSRYIASLLIFDENSFLLNDNDFRLDFFSQK